MSKPPRSMVDYLAEQLSRKTGTTFRVLRGHIKHGDSVVATRYSLCAKRGEHGHVFQASRPMKVDELKRWLASINDMVSMGFIRVAAPESVAEMKRLIEEGTQAHGDEFYGPILWHVERLS